MFSLNLSWIEMKLLELNKIDYDWIEFENKDSKWPPNHFGNKID
jgi:hypothetical protein